MAKNLLYNVSTRSPETLPEDQIEQAIAAGTHSYASGARINVIDPDSNETVSVPAIELKEAVGRGFKVERVAQGAVRKYVEDRKGLAGAAQVFASETIDEAGMGIPGIVAKRFSDPLEVAKREALKKQHQLSGIAGALTGFGASLLYGGPLFKGASKAGAVAAKGAEGLVSASLKAAGVRGVSEQAAKGILAQAGKKAVEMGVEGAVVSAPRAITEAMLGDPEQAGETLLLGAGLGTALGVPAGLLGGAMSKIASRRARVAADEAALKANAAKADAAVAAESKSLQAGEPTSVDHIGPIFDVNDATQVIRDGVATKAPGAGALMQAAERQGVKVPLVMQSDSATMKAIAADTARSPTIAGQSLAKELEQTAQGMQDTMSRGLGGISAEKAMHATSKAQVGDEVSEILRKRIKQQSEGLSSKYKALDDEAAGFAVPEDARLAAIESLEKNPLYGVAALKAEQSRAQTYVDSVLQADSVPKLNSIITGLNNDIQKAAQAGDSNMVGFLRPVKQAAADARAAALDAGGLAGTRKAIDSEYRAFREFLDEVAGKGKMGNVKNPRLLMEKMGDIPPERLVNKLFDVKDSRALTFFQKEFPDAFEKLRQFKLQELAGKHVSVETGRFKVPSLLREVKNLSPEAKNALFTPKQREALEDLRVLHERFPKMDNPGSAAAMERLRFFSNPIAYASQNVADAAKVAALRGQAAYDGLLFLEQATKKAAEQIDRIPDIIDGMAEKAGKSGGFTKSKGSTDIGPKSIGALLALFGDDRDPPKTPEAAFERLQEKIQQPLREPGKAKEKSGILVRAIEEGGAPLAAEAMVMKQTQALSYLDRTMPRALVPSSLVSQRKFRPSDYEMSKFARRIEVVMNPFKILDDLKAGTITREQVEALDAVYPKYMGIIRTRIVNAIAEKPRNFPYDSRVKLSLILGMELDPSLTAESIRSLQATYAQQSEEQGGSGQAQPQSKLNLGGVAKMGQSNRMMTDIEKVQNRRG